MPKTKKVRLKTCRKLLKKWSFWHAQLKTTASKCMAIIFIAVLITRSWWLLGYVGCIWLLMLIYKIIHPKKWRVYMVDDTLYHAQFFPKKGQRKNCGYIRLLKQELDIIDKLAIAISPDIETAARWLMINPSCTETIIEVQDYDFNKVHTNGLIAYYDKYGKLVPKEHIPSLPVFANEPTPTEP